MPFVPDIANDMQYLDGLRTMTLKQRDGLEFVLNCVIDEPATFKEMEASHGQVQQGDQIFIWQKAASDQPLLGSVLVDDAGTYWTILSVLTKDLVETWEAHARNLSIRSTIDNKATILRATYSHGGGNEAVALWKSELTDVPACFQPSMEAAQIFLDSEFTKTTYRVIFSHPVPIELAGGEYRLVDSQGNRYRVMEYFDEQRIDTLPVAIAVRITEGSEYWSEQSSESGSSVSSSSKSSSDGGSQSGGSM